MLQKLCCASRFCKGGGKLWTADPSKCSRKCAANASWGGLKLRLLAEARSRAPAACRTRKPGQSAHDETTQGVFPRSRLIAMAQVLSPLISVPDHAIKVAIAIVWAL